MDQAPCCHIWGPLGSSTGWNTHLYHHSLHSSLARAFAVFLFTCKLCICCSKTGIQFFNKPSLDSLNREAASSSSSSFFYHSTLLSHNCSLHLSTFCSQSSFSQLSCTQRRTAHIFYPPFPTTTTTMPFAKEGARPKLLNWIHLNLYYFVLFLKHKYPR